MTEEIRAASRQGDDQAVARPGSVYQRLAPVRLVAQWRLEAGRFLEITPLVDAIEIFNARCTNAADNQKALEFALEHHLPARPARMPMPLLSWEKPAWCCRNSAGRTSCGRYWDGQVQGGLSPIWVHFASYYARWRKMVV
jgi:hypothetical protein